MELQRERDREREILNWKRTHPGEDYADVLGEFICASYKRLIDCMDARRQGEQLAAENAAKQKKYLEKYLGEFRRMDRLLKTESAKRQEEILQYFQQFQRKRGKGRRPSLLIVCCGEDLLRVSERYRGVRDYAWAEKQLQDWKIPGWASKDTSGDTLAQLLRRRHPRSSRKAKIAAAGFRSIEPDTPWHPSLNEDAKEKRRQLRWLLGRFSEKAGLPRQDEPRKIKMPSADYMSIEEIDTYRGRSRELDEIIKQLKQAIREVAELDERAFAAFFSLVADSPASAVSDPVIKKKPYHWFGLMAPM